MIPSIFLISAAAAVIAIIGFVLVHKLTKPIDLHEHQSFLDAMLNIVGTLVSILLGLLVAAALDHYQNLEQSIDTEAANVSELYRISFGLPLKTRERIRILCEEYSRSVVHDEWPAMEKGMHSPKVMDTYRHIVNTIVKFRPANDGESNLHNSLLAAMQTIGDCRRQRLLVLHSSWNRQLMPMLLMCSCIVLSFAYLYVKRGALLHGILIAFVALALGGNLGLVFLLSNPYSGDWKITPRGFELNIKLLNDARSHPDSLIDDSLDETSGRAEK